MTIKGKKVLSPWEGDWEARLNNRIKQLGYATYRDFLQARQGVSYDELAKE